MMSPDFGPIMGPCPSGPENCISAKNLCHNLIHFGARFAIRFPCENFKPSNRQTVKPSNPQTLKPSNPQTLKPSKLRSSFVLVCISGTVIISLLWLSLWHVYCYTSYFLLVSLWQSLLILLPSLSILLVLCSFEAATTVAQIFSGLIYIYIYICTSCTSMAHIYIYIYIYIYVHRVPRHRVRRPRSLADGHHILYRGIYIYIYIYIESIEVYISIYM